jgi:pimeloyl-ACP methyl ester carboxylesterase
MAYINLRGHQTWSVDYPASGEPLLALHGGLSSTESFEWQVRPLAENRFHFYGYDRTAHGRTGVREGFYHFDFQTQEAISYIEDVIGGPAHLIGHSDGGIIALMVAIARPDLVLSIVAIGANYSWDCGLELVLDQNGIEISEENRQKFLESSPDAPEWQARIFHKAYEVWATEPNISLADLGSINCPVLVLNGDDEVFNAHHGVELYQALPNAQLAIVPGTSHAVLKEKNELALALIDDFYNHPLRGQLREVIAPDLE